MQRHPPFVAIGEVVRVDQTVVWFVMRHMAAVRSWVEFDGERGFGIAVWRGREATQRGCSDEGSKVGVKANENDRNGRKEGDRGGKQ